MDVLGRNDARPNYTPPRRRTGRNAARPNRALLGRRYLKVLAKDVGSEAIRLGTASPRVCAEIDVGNLISNARACAAAAEKGGCRCMAVVKADAYGHGAAVVARSLHRHCGIEFFAVATLPEALELRAAGLAPPVRVVVLGASVPSEWPVYSRRDPAS